MFKAKVAAVFTEDKPVEEKSVEMAAAPAEVAPVASSAPAKKASKKSEKVKKEPENEAQRKKPGKSFNNVTKHFMLYKEDYAKACQIRAQWIKDHPTPEGKNPRKWFFGEIPEIAAMESYQKSEAKYKAEYEKYKKDYDQWVIDFPEEAAKEEAAQKIKKETNSKNKEEKQGKGRGKRVSYDNLDQFEIRLTRQQNDLMHEAFVRFREENTVKRVKKPKLEVPLTETSEVTVSAS